MGKTECVVAVSTGPQLTLRVDCTDDEKFWDVIQRRLRRGVVGAKYRGNSRNRSGLVISTTSDGQNPSLYQPLKNLSRSPARAFGIPEKGIMQAYTDECRNNCKPQFLHTMAEGAFLTIIPPVYPCRHRRAPWRGQLRTLARLQD